MVACHACGSGNYSLSIAVTASCTAPTEIYLPTLRYPQEYGDGEGGCGRIGWTWLATGWAELGWAGVALRWCGLGCGLSCGSIVGWGVGLGVGWAGAGAGWVGINGVRGVDWDGIGSD